MASVLTHVPRLPFSLDPLIAEARRRMRRRRVLLAALVVGLLAAVGAAYVWRSPRPSPPKQPNAVSHSPSAVRSEAHFDHIPAGWHQYRESRGDVLALNWRYRPNSRGWAPSMPPGGIAVYVHFLPGRPHYRPLRLVLPRRPVTLLEGTQDIPEYRIYGRVGRSDLMIFVDIRKLHPSHAQLAAARRVISLIRFPTGTPSK
jgi:hypothetical protein